LAVLLACSGATVAAAPAAASPAGPYQPYEFLVGEWDVAPAGGPAFGVVRFRWGPNQSYLWYSVSLVENGGEQPHLEGMLMWNAHRKNLDMLLAVDPMGGGGAQEQGTVHVEADGTVVRDITMIASDPGRAQAGGHAPTRPTTAPQFRQTFKAVGRDTVLTDALRKTDGGWVATFPGSDHLVMIRRASAPETRR
jgi:hypothetical protein